VIPITLSCDFTHKKWVKPLKHSLKGQPIFHLTAIAFDEQASQEG